MNRFLGAGLKRLVDGVAGLHEVLASAARVAELDEGFDVFRKTAASVAAPAVRSDIEVARTDAGIGCGALGHEIVIDAELGAKIEDLIGEDDLEGQETITEIFDHIFYVIF